MTVMRERDYGPREYLHNTWSVGGRQGPSQQRARLKPPRNYASEENLKATSSKYISPKERYQPRLLRHAGEQDIRYKVKRTRPRQLQKRNKTQKVLLLRRHPEIGFGFSIRGGIEHGTGIFISSINKYSDASSQGLKVGDQLLKANNQSFSGITHDDAVKFIQSHKTLRVVTLSIGILPGSKVAHTEYQWIDCYGRPCSPLNNDAYNKTAIRDTLVNQVTAESSERKVNIVVGNKSKLGLLIRGGSEYGLGIFVAGIDEDSVADRSGIMVGEQILDVNGISFNHITHADAAHIIRTSKMMTMWLRDVGKIPFARIVVDETEWLDGGSLPPRESEYPKQSRCSSKVSIFQQGIGGSQLNHQLTTGLSPYRWIEEKAQQCLTVDDWDTLKYYIREYVHGHISINGFVLSLFDLFETKNQLSLVSEIRGIVRAHDINTYDEMMLRKEVEVIKTFDETKAFTERLAARNQNPEKILTSNTKPDDTKRREETSPVRKLRLEKISSIQTLPSERQFSPLKGGRTTEEDFSYKYLQEDSSHSTNENATEDTALSVSPQPPKSKRIVDESIRVVAITDEYATANCAPVEPIYAVVDDKVRENVEKKAKTNDSNSPDECGIISDKSHEYLEEYAKTNSEPASSVTKIRTTGESGSLEPATSVLTYRKKKESKSLEPSSTISKNRNTEESGSSVPASSVLKNVNTEESEDTKRKESDQLTYAFDFLEATESASNQNGNDLIEENPYPYSKRNDDNRYPVSLQDEDDDSAKEVIENIPYATPNNPHTVGSLTPKHAPVVSPMNEMNSNATFISGNDMESDVNNPTDVANNISPFRSPVRPKQLFRDLKRDGNLNLREGSETKSKGKTNDPISDYRPRFLSELNKYFKEKSVKEQTSDVSSVTKPRKNSTKNVGSTRTNHPRNDVSTNFEIESLNFDPRPSMEQRYANFSVNDILRQKFLPTTRLEGNSLTSNTEEEEDEEELNDSFENLLAEKKNDFSKLSSLNIQNQYEYETSEKYRTKVSESNQTPKNDESKSYGKPVMSPKTHLLSTSWQNDSLKKQLQDIAFTPSSRNIEKGHSIFSPKLRKTKNSDILLGKRDVGETSILPGNDMTSSIMVDRLNIEANREYDDKVSTSTSSRMFFEDRENETPFINNHNPQEHQYSIYDRNVPTKQDIANQYGLPFSNLANDDLRAIDGLSNASSNPGNHFDDVNGSIDISSDSSSTQYFPNHNSEDSVETKISSIKERIEAFSKKGNFRSLKNEINNLNRSSEYQHNDLTSKDINIPLRSDHDQQYVERIVEIETESGEPGFKVDNRVGKNGTYIYISEIQKPDLNTIAVGDIVVAVDNKPLKTGMKKGLANLMIQNAFKFADRSHVSLTIRR